MALEMSAAQARITQMAIHAAVGKPTSWQANPPPEPEPPPVAAAQPTSASPAVASPDPTSSAAGVPAAASPATDEEMVTADNPLLSSSLSS